MACCLARLLRRVRRFLAEYCPPGGVGELSTAEVTAALLAEGDHHAVSSVKRLGHTLRSFLRYAFLTALIDHDLSGASIPVRAHQPSLSPIGISWKQTTAFLAACDRDSVVGRRDYAVILLARLGLRATEVAGLQLNDIDWHHGEITVRSKGQRDERMPFPAEVGEALVDYLMRSRPTDAPEVRTVFLAARAPRRSMDRVTVSSMIGRARVQVAQDPPRALHLHRRTGSGAAGCLREHDPVWTP